MEENISHKSSPEKTPQMELAERIKRTALERDEVTRNLLVGLLAGQDANSFVEKACKLAGIQSPKKSGSLAVSVFNLQKDILHFPQTDTYDGCDGKLGPITFNALLKKFPALNPEKRRRVLAASSAKRKDLAKKAGLPIPPQSHESSEKYNQSIDPKDAITIGDSLTYGFAKPFYKGTGLYKEYSNRFFKSGRSIITMRRRLEKDCPSAKAYIIGAAANDIYYRSVDRLEKEFLRIIEITRRKNPNARIILLSLHGDNYRGWRKHKARIIRKIEELNRRLRKIAQNDPHIKLIEMRKEIYGPETRGKKILEPDQLHYTWHGARAVARLLKDELRRGQHGSLASYM